MEYKVKKGKYSKHQPYMGGAVCFLHACGRRGVVVRLLDDTLPARDMNVE